MNHLTQASLSSEPLSTNAVVTRTPDIAFVDRDTFNTVFSSNPAFDIAQFVNMTRCPSGVECSQSGAQRDNYKLSPRLMWYLRYANLRTMYVLFGTNFSSYELSASVSQPHPVENGEDYKNLESVFDSRMLATQEEGSSFYEILPVGDADLLVIMENGFLNYLTRSKSTAKVFVLHCLSELDRFKVDKSRLNELYLNLSFIDGYDRLLKARLG